MTIHITGATISLPMRDRFISRTMQRICATVSPLGVVSSSLSRLNLVRDEELTYFYRSVRPVMDRLVINVDVSHAAVYVDSSRQGYRRRLPL